MLGAFPQTAPPLVQRTERLSSLWPAGVGSAGRVVHPPVMSTATPPTLHAVSVYQVTVPPQVGEPQLHCEHVRLSANAA